MKLSVKEVVYLGVYSIVFLFIIGAVFYMKFSGKNGMLKATGEVYEANKEKQIISENDNRIGKVTETAAPEIRYVNRTYTAGEKFLVHELFEVKQTDSSDYVSAAEGSGFSFFVQDILDRSGNSFVDGAQADDDVGEELTSVIFDKETGMICFHQSGIYTIQIKVWGETGRVVMGEITFPVEIG